MTPNTSTPKIEGSYLDLPELGNFYITKDPLIVDQLASGKAIWVDPNELPTCKNWADGIFYLLSNPLNKITIDNEGRIEEWLASWLPSNILQYLYGGIDRWRDTKGTLWESGSYPIDLKIGKMEAKFIIRIRPKNLKKVGGYTSLVSVSQGGTWGYLRNYYEHEDLINKLTFPKNGSTPQKDKFIFYCNTLRELGFWLPKNPGLSAFSREMIQSESVKAFQGLKEIPEKILKFSRIGFGVGRFELFKEGTIIVQPGGEPIVDTDLVSAFPYGISLQQHPGPAYTKWSGYDSEDTIWKDLSWIWDDDEIAYLLVVAEEITGDVNASPMRHRKRLLEGESLVFFPKGKNPPAVLGKYQLRARLLRYGKDWHNHLKIRGGFVGRIAKDFKPFIRPMETFWEARQLNKTIGKFIDCRIVGNFMGTYPELVDDKEENPSNELGTYVRKALPTYHPVYAFGVIDWILSIADMANLLTPADKLLHNSIDGFTTIGSPPNIPGLPKEGPGSLKITKLKKWTGYTDHFTGSDQSDKWKKTLEGDHLTLDVVIKPSLVKFMGRPGDPEELLNLYKEAINDYHNKPLTPKTYRIKLGSSKRRSKMDPNFDITKDVRNTECLMTTELDDFITDKILGDDTAQFLVLSEDGSNGSATT